MKRILIGLAALGLSAGVGFADGHSTGDAAAGEKAFKKCKSCHMIKADDGEVIVKGGKSGPNLYGIVGRVAGTQDGFRYGKDLIRAGDAGLVWDEAQLAAWMENPKDFLRAYLDDSKAKSKMNNRLKKGGDDVAAYLASVGPAPVEAEAEAASDG